MESIGAGYFSIDAAGNLLTCSDTTNSKTKYKSKSTRRHKPRALLPDEEAVAETQLYQTRVYSEELNCLLQIDITKKGHHRVFIRGSNPKLKIHSEIEMHVK